MSYKENNSTGDIASIHIKPEPQEPKLTPLKASNSWNAQTTPDEPIKVKPEPTEATRVFEDRGIPVPADIQGLTSGSSHANVIPKSEDASTVDAIKTLEESRPIFFTTYGSAAEVPYTPEGALREGLNMVKSIKDGIKKLQLGSRLRQEVWSREIASLESQGAPASLIAVCGATGAGKSSILNAILDDNIVPTSGMRACTAVVTEIAYHTKKTIDADISFLSEAEWKEELGVLLHDLVDEDGSIRRTTDLKSDAGVAWQKVHAVYPTISQEQLVTMTPEQVIACDPKIERILGQTKNIVAKDSKAFAAEIAKYIDSKDQSRGGKSKSRDKNDGKSLMDKVREAAGQSRSSRPKKDDKDAPALWPLIRQVNVRCSAAALSTGAILVDLPGVADANAARNSIAKDYMKKCDCVWILAPITRAVDDKTARDLLGDAFKMQLMNGNYDDHTITFIASKCDDISCSEVIRALRLEDEPELVEIEERLDNYEDETRVWKKKKHAAEQSVESISNEMKKIRAVLAEYKEHLQALKDGSPFTPKLTSKKASQLAASTGRKRKNHREGKKGPAKKRRSSLSDSDDEDELRIGSDDDIESGSDNDSDQENDSDNDRDSDKSDSDSDSGSNNDGDDPDKGMEDDEEPVTEEFLEVKIKETDQTLKAARERHSEAWKEKKTANDSINTLKKQISKAQRDKNAFCSLKRSEFSRDVLKEDFRTGLKDLDDAAAEERDPDNFDPSVNLRDYDAIDLPVFTCSSRDYVRLKGQVKGDGEPTCFSNVKDTGIPDLQQWCHTLTVASRERAARNFLNHLKTFVTSIQTYVQGIGDVTAADRTALREKWESTPQHDDDPEEDNELAYMESSDVDPFEAILGTLSRGLGRGLYEMQLQPPLKVDAHGEPAGITPRLTKEFDTIVKKNVQELQHHFRDGLEEKCRVGALNAANAALETSDEFANSQHWCTYRATLRRHGSWRRDLNVELINPFTRNIAHSWSKVFESDLFGPFEAAIKAGINKLVKEVEDSAAAGLKDRTRMQGEVCLEEANATLRATMELVKETMNDEQKETSRCLAPHIQAQLIPGYDTAMEERGKGSVARQKAFFHGFIAEIKDEVFDGGAGVIMDRLTEAAEAVGATLKDALGKLAQKVEVSLSVLWEGVRDDPKQVYARNTVVGVTTDILGQIKLWVEAGKTKQQGQQAAKTG